MKRQWDNKSGAILVRQSDKDHGGCGIVEMLHLWSENRSGCVIGYWEVREVDGSPTAEFQSVHDRVMKTEYDTADLLLDALRFGQRLADLLIETEPDNHKSL